ncbi:MAG: HAMP domain-containing histidine kinase [Calditrichaeota bacterium]|nr:HAMP domain-containing histidine kinase [Calditrichota bacterium]
MNSLSLIKSHINNFESLDDLALAACKALSEVSPETKFVLIKLNKASRPFKVLYVQKLRAELNETYTGMDKVMQAVGQKLTPHFIPDKSVSDPFYILLTDRALNSEAQDLLQTWQTVHTMTRRFCDANQTSQEIYFANQISQLLHDVESLINMFQKPDLDAAVLKERLEYQKRTNNNLLFYVRELETIKASVGLKELINACLQKRNISVSRFSVVYDNIKEDEKIEVDVELFDQAFGEILQNAIEATDGDPDKISLRIEKTAVDLHFTLKHWIIISIIDKGKGVNPDFLPWLTMPYFSTWKEEGHTGFGLAIAKKILHAHHGFMEINFPREGGTEVKMFLPGIGNE